MAGEMGQGVRGRVTDPINGEISYPVLNLGDGEG